MINESDSDCDSACCFFLTSVYDTHKTISIISSEVDVIVDFPGVYWFVPFHNHVFWDGSSFATLSFS